MANEPKWTAGPWQVTSISQDTGSIGIGQKDLRIVIADVHNAASLWDMLTGAMARGGGGFDQNDCHTQFANARLIAAAPELYEAADGLIRKFEEMNPMRTADYHSGCDCLRCKFDALKATLVKARGE